MTLLPDDLTELPNWVLWRYEVREGKSTKVPCQPDGRRASVIDRNTWQPYESVCEVLQRDSQQFAGIGFVFCADDPFVGVDLDSCIEAGEVIKPWARPIVERFADTYSEISPSGRGVKIFAKAKLNGRGKRKEYEDHAIEIYDRGRFFTVTGRALNGAPLQLEDHQVDVEKLYQLLTEAPAQNGNGPTQGKIPQGSRHNTLVSLAGSMRRRGMSAKAIAAALWVENCARCDPPYDRQHIRKIAESSGTWEPDNQRPSSDLHQPYQDGSKAETEEPPKPQFD